ncbi:ABC transporter ATP-binding protein [Halopiger xanaduensis]|uniref:Sulfate-transporting ATPase n=1 Tax=Halopiger xanaduensis (strain DSM 18323 / JCM 14033 / SH-6) TaxID=797210 RepID=F8D544_HALXS|nr:ABC transporter ATP-binding protein [Halopiger xanaduensis]AEH36396.1 Sulfate-transporting ATPase [Halopiger xanaduensis SH-6]
MQITITDVRKRYGDVVALDGPSFTVPSGSTFGVLGTNGAGKTTLFELLVGHDRPDEGRIEVGGIDVAEAGHRVRERVAFLPEHAGFPPAMTGREVLDVHARIRGLTNQRERIDDALETVGLADAADRAVEGYSNGMGRRLGLAAALIADPPVLVLDEPTAGLDPRGVAAFHQTIERLGRETDTTIVLSSHVLSEVERLCDDVAILEDGHLRAAGPIDDLRSETDTDDRVTVSLRPANDQARPDLLEAVQDCGDVTETDDAIEVTCDREAAFGVCGTVDPSLLDGFEVREPGLEAVFQDVLTDEAPDLEDEDADEDAGPIRATEEVSA